MDIILDGEPSSLTKSYATVGNIIELMNYRIDRGALSACDAVNMLRTYIDEAYGGFYGTARSELFLGEAAAWDADELVALLRCARALGGEYSGLFVPDTASLLGLSGILFSAKGLLAEDFIGFDGSCAHDAAVSPETYTALLKMRAIIDEGLITVEREGAVASIGADGEEVLPPVVICNGEYTRLLPVSEKIAGFGAAVSAELAGSEKRLSAALGFLDYLFSDGAKPLLCYGTDAFFSVTGRDFSPTEAALADAERYAGGDYNLYKYNYVGAGVLPPYGDISAERRGLIDTALSLGVAERVGRVTDDGVYFPPSPISALSDTDERMLSENGYAEELSAVFSGILDGTLPTGTPSDIEALISSLKRSPDREEYLALVTREYEIRLRIYKAILK